MSSDLMDTETGGEQTQYESITTQDEHKKSTGQFGDEAEADAGTSQSSGVSAPLVAKKVERAADKFRKGKIFADKNAMGDSTTGQTGEAQEEGFGRVEEAGQRGSERLDDTKERRAEGYGEGNDVGA